MDPTDSIPSTFKAIFDHLNDGVYFVDPRRHILYWNRAAERITGYTREQVVGQFCASNLLMHVNDSGETLCNTICPLATTLTDGQVRETQVYLHHIDGHRVPVAVRVVPIYENNEPGAQITGAVEIFSESTSLASAMLRIEELQREAMLDPLIRIGNRRMTQSRLEHALTDWEQQKIPFGVLMIDIDFFKRVNDSYGHDTGDQVLKMTAGSLSGGLRSYDFLGRWGGEEFLAIVTNINLAGLKRIAERMRMLVETSLIFLNGNDRSIERAVRITVSGGGAIIRAGETLEALINRADRSLYQSKNSGRNRVTIDEGEPALTDRP